MKFLKLFFIVFLSACTLSNKKEIVPAIIPSSAHEPKVKVVMPDNIIGAVEPFYVLPLKSAFLARIDTGATTSSIDIQTLTHFERDGKHWVSFDVTNSHSKEKHHFEKPVLKKVKITRSENEEHRIKVMMDIKFAGKKMSKEFTLAERDDFNYQGLIGRNILTGNFIVDTSLSNTLK